MQIVELLINGSYVFEVYVPWKYRIPFICNSALFVTLHLFNGKMCYFLKI